MRSSGLRVTAVFGLFAGCTQAGAHLTLSAPNGPGSVSSFRVVLATPDAIPTVGGQRVRPGELTTQSVSYYYQRTIAGGSAEKVSNVDGFAIKIEPDPSMTETQFIPFVLMYEGDNIVAVGTFHATDSLLPSPIIVVADEIDKYVLDVEPALQISDTDAVEPGSVRVIECFHDDQSSFVSGVVWRPKSGGEMRLLFPDDGGLDATKRTLDLDCDGSVVTVESSGNDCDDTREWFNRGAGEMCDGQDTNCDGLQNMVVACTASIGGQTCADPATNMGLALCNDATGEQGDCQSDPQCVCNLTSGCPHCRIPTDFGTSAGMLKPCQPSIGYVYLVNYGCTDTTQCTVDVAQINGGWKAEVSPELPTPTFGLRATGVHGKVLLRVKRPEGPVVEIAGMRGQSTGDVSLVITSGNATYLKTIDLQLDEINTVCQGMGPFQMQCYN